MSNKRWLLPDGVDEVLPPHAARLEALRRKILDRFERWGYQLVIPPVVEFTDALLSGEDDLDLQTLKVVDQLSGKMMGVRADITPQVARIDAHRLKTNVPQRLCYLGPVVHAKPDKFAGSRNPLQIGAELYGHDGIESDAEVMCLMSEVLNVAGLAPITLELGHMGVFKALAESANLNREQKNQILDILLRKSFDELSYVLTQFDVSGDERDEFVALLKLNGGAEILPDIKGAFQEAAADVKDAIESFCALVTNLKIRIPDVNLHLDLAELRGFHYHTGITFAAYAANIGRAIAWGGRYDNVGRDFGNARAATGFSADLKTLISISPIEAAKLTVIYAPAESSESLIEKIASLRADGNVVVQALPGQLVSARVMGCDHELVFENDNWVVKAL